MLGRRNGDKRATTTAGEEIIASRNLGPLLSVTGESARIEGKFEIAESIQIECEVGGELTVGGRLVIGEKGIVNANVQTVDAVIMGQYDGNMVATGNVEITATGRVSGNIETDSLVISKGGFFNGNVRKINGDEGRGDDGQRNGRSVYVLDDKRAGQQK
jgi:cytoskeletal protein CcmA (bactofilin family)